MTCNIKKYQPLNVLLFSGLILVVSLGLLALFTKRYADFWFKFLVSDKAELVNEVLGSEELPSTWRLRWFETASRSSSALQHLAPWLKRWYLYRMDRLILSVQRSSYINKDLKAEYLEALQEIRDEWQERQDLF